MWANRNEMNNGFLGGSGFGNNGGFPVVPAGITYQQLTYEERREMKEREKLERKERIQGRREMRATEKEERRMAKEEIRLAKEERRRHKEEARQEKEGNEQEREEKKKEREERKKERAEKRAKRAHEPAIIIEQLPQEEMSHLYLDGNNMMFVASVLRNMTLHRAKKRVEQLIARLAVQFLEAVQKSIAKTILVFDDTRAHSKLRVRAGTQDFELCSARPRFTTSDDAIVEWIANIRNTPGVKLCVTSDRGLMDRIEQEGGKVMKPKKWFLLAASLISGHPVENLDSWMDQWVAQQGDL